MSLFAPTASATTAAVGPQTPMPKLLGTVVYLSLTLTGVILLGFGVEVPPKVATPIVLLGPQLSVAILFLVRAIRRRQEPALVPARDPQSNTPTVKLVPPRGVEDSGELTPLEELEPMLLEPEAETEAVED